jgi:hypothetical protein
MFERFTRTSRQVVVLAQQQARELGHNYIGTEHLLLGLLLDAASPAGQVLGRFGVSAGVVRARVVEIVGTSEEPQLGQIPFTPRAKKVLELALREAESLGDDRIGSLHLLLGLMGVNEGVAMRILLRANVDPVLLREAVIAAGPEHELPGAGGDEPLAPSGAEPPRPPSVIRFSVVPDARARRLLMRAAAHALRDGRSEFAVEDLARALCEDPQSRAPVLEIREDAPPSRLIGHQLRRLRGRT